MTTLITHRTTPSTVVRGTALAAGLALLANLAVFLVGDVGAPVRVVTGNSPDGADLRFVDVAVATVALLAVGAVALAVLERFRDDGLRIWTVLAVAVAVLSIPPVLRLDTDAGSKLVLAVMHLVVGGAAVAGPRLARR
jgi:hypothetical protein